MRLFVIAIIFIMGAIFCTYKTSDLREGFDSKEECPNLLIQKGKELHLMYTNKAKIPGVNPVKFDNLEDYVEFVNWQRAKGIRCPILYFQQMYDAQNNVGYKMIPDIIEKQGGLPNTINSPKEQPLYDANHDDKPYNDNSYAGFDGEDQYVGVYTPLDKNFTSTEKVSGNAMDVHWGGSEYSYNLVNEGVYKEDSRVGSLGNKSKKESPALQREIATRYGGEINNKPLNRILR
jgi:hypothetical protein